MRWLVTVLVLAACGSLVAVAMFATQPDPQPTDAVSSPAPAPSSPPARIATPPPKIRPVEGVGSNWMTYQDEITGRLSTALINRSGGTIFAIGCLDGEIWTSIKGMAVPISDIDDEFSVRWRVDSSPVVAETWDGVDDLQTGHVAMTSDDRLYIQARYGTSLLIELTGYLGVAETFRFDLAGMFNSPAQWNIDNCGEY